jgi:tetratricopeptide (TPR) repeat protein
MFGDLNNYHEEDEILDALKRYREMLTHHSNIFFDLYEYECIIDYYIEQLNFKDAIKAVGHAIKQHPYAASLKIRYAQLLIETGKPARALGIIKSMGQPESTDFEFYLARGIALNLTGKHTEARKSFERAFQLCEDGRDELSYNIAQSYMQIGMLSQATKYLLQAYKYNEDNILVLYDLASHYEKLDCPEKSIIYYKKYLDLDPFAEHVWNNLGLVYAGLDDLENALEAFDLAVAINPSYYPAYYNKAEMLVLNNDIPGAIGVYNELLDCDRTNTRALCDLGTCFEEIGNFQEALIHFQKALEISSSCPDAWYGSGLIYYRQRKFRLSIASFKKAVNLQPVNSDYWFMLGEAYVGMKKLNQAISAYSKASELNPLDFEAWMSCAQVLYRKKRLDEAIYMLLRLYQYNHDNPTLNYRLAAYYTYQGDTRNALMYFEKGLTINFPEYKEIFRQFPKTKSCRDFRCMVENHIHPVESFKKSP